VSLTTPGQPGPGGPYLAPGGQFARTKNADELGDLFAAATPLLQKINTGNLSTVLGELGQASQGEGPSIARSIGAGTRLARDLDSSLSAQEVALNSFARFVQATAPLAGNLNNASAGVNAALPAFNSEEADYQKFLNAVIPFANDLSSLLTNYRPDIDTILSAGDNVSRVLVAQQSNIGQLIQGAYSYFHTIGTGAASAQKLPDGSTYAYFNTFILFSDVNNLVCGLLAPAAPGLAFLQPLQQALAGAGSAFNCSSQLAAFNAAQGTTAPTGPSAGSPVASTNSAAQSVTNQVYGIVGAPAGASAGSNTGKSSGLSGFIGGLLGGGL